MAEIYDLLSGFGDSFGGIWAAMAVFARISLMVFLLPGLGENGISMRIRLMAALGIAIICVPVVAPTLVPPQTVGAAIALVGLEAAVGFVLGFALRLMVFGLQILGNIVSQALSISQVLGEGIATEPNTTISTLLMLAGVTLVVSADLHVEAVGIVIESYDVFPPGNGFSTDGAAFWLSRTATAMLGFILSLSMPFIALNFLYNLTLGFLNRAMPQLMVSFVGMPAITGAGLFLLVITIGVMLSTWAAHFHDALDGLSGAAA